METHANDCPELVQTPLVENMIVPEVYRDTAYDVGDGAGEPLPERKVDVPSATFAFARKNVSGDWRPQAIAHRGYKAKFPENTMGAFKGAVEVGAEAIETDIHLSRDGVVVLSHDKDLKRCFGRQEKIIDCDYEFLSKLKTLKEPRQSLPRLADLLEYVALPGLEDIWLLLDIKLDNDPEDVIRLIGDTIRSVQPSTSRPWSSRIVLGIWAAKYLPLCARFLPDFPIAYIGYSIAYASYFFSVPNVSFNMLLAALMTPWGRVFMRKAHCDKRPVFGWTVNEAALMRWAIRHKLDGVITDDPKLFLEVRKGWNEGMQESLGLDVWLKVVWVNCFAFVLSIIFRAKFGFEGGRSFVRSRV